MHSSRHTFDRCLLNTTTVVNHDTLGYTRYAETFVLELSSKCLVFHLQDCVIGQFCLDIVCAGCVQKSHIAYFDVVASFGYSLDLSTEPK